MSRKHEKNKSTSLHQLIDAVIHNDPHRVNQLLSEGTNPNGSPDVAGVTPLHFAAQNNALLVLPLLIEAGADLFAETKDHYTPLDVAIMHNHEKIVQALLAYEQEVDAIIQ